MDGLGAKVESAGWRYEYETRTVIRDQVADTKLTVEFYLHL